MQANYANALCHLNPTPLSVAVLAPCAWSENLACGVAWQSVILGRNGAWQGALNSAKRNTAWRSEFGNETARHINTTNLTKYSKFSNTNSTKHYFAGKTTRDKFGLASVAKMGQCLGGGLLSLSLSLSR